MDVPTKQRSTSGNNKPTISTRPLDVVILGLSITSSWGNGHATTYRALTKGLHQRGHKVLFLERDVPWYARYRDLSQSDNCTISLYNDLNELSQAYVHRIREADIVIVGSYVPDGVAVGEFVQKEAKGLTAFYDIDTPLTLARLDRGETEYITPKLIPGYDLYLTFTGGPLLEKLERKYHAPRARPLYCAVDPDLYFPTQVETKWDLGYMGTYSPDRQLSVEQLLIKPAMLHPDRRFVAAGPNYPQQIVWPDNLERIDHLPPQDHRDFYNAQRFTLNITRQDMKRTGYAPSVRLFEAAACGTPIISDIWPGLESFFKFGIEIFIARTPKDVAAHLYETTCAERESVGTRARETVLKNHTAAHRAKELEGYIDECCRQLSST